MWRWIDDFCVRRGRKSLWCGLRLEPNVGSRKGVLEDFGYAQIMARQLIFRGTKSYDVHTSIESIVLHLATCLELGPNQIVPRHGDFLR